MKRRRINLGSADATHVYAAKHLVNQAWGDLERMPPTCRGGIEMASRALGYAERAKGHLDSIEGEGTRAGSNETFGLANQATRAANATLNFFAGTCTAPYDSSKRVPLFSRGKIAAERAEDERKAKLRARRR